MYLCYLQKFLTGVISRLGSCSLLCTLPRSRVWMPCSANILLKQLFVGQSSSYQFPLIIFVQDSTQTHQSHCLRQNLKSVQKNLRLPCLSGPNLPWLCAGLQYCIQRCCEHCHSRTKECWGSSKLLLNHFKTIFWNIFQVEFHDEDWLCPYMFGLVENS